jgi:hypothetical protein
MQALEGWRGITHKFSPEMAWDDDNHQTADINAARMRAKYYGAKVIINRPTLAAALHDDWSTLCIRQSESPLPGHGHTSQQSSPTAPYAYHTAHLQQHENYGELPAQSETRPVKKLPALKPEIYYGAQTCIEAAVRSTTAFDGVPPRLIVTNIFGTGHA